MRVKHWQGYGCVNMKKLKTSINGNKKTIVVEVVGNHEYGLERNDKYDVFYWICKRFAKGYGLCKHSYTGRNSRNYPATVCRNR